MSKELQKLYDEREKNQNEIEARLVEQRQLENHYDRLLRGEKEKARKARTRRLIERGAMLESLMGVSDDVTNEEIKEVLTIALHSDEAHRILLTLRSGRRRRHPRWKKRQRGTGLRPPSRSRAYLCTLRVSCAPAEGILNLSVQKVRSRKPHSYFGKRLSAFRRAARKEA